VQLYAKVPVIERCIGRPIAPVPNRQRNVVGQKIDPPNGPAFGSTRKSKKPLARGDQDFFGHVALLFLAARQGLQHKDFACRPHRIAQPHPITKGVAVNENSHMLAKRRLIVENISPHPPIGGKDIVQNFTHGRPRGLNSGTIHVASQIRGEENFCHGCNMPQGQAFDNSATISRMKRRSFLLAMLVPAPVHAHSTRVGNIAIGHSWALPSQGTDGQVFFPLVNNGSEPDALTGATSEICEKIELRANDHYEESPLKSIQLERGKPVPMRPTARHLRLVGLKRPLNEYDSFKILLDFLHAGKVEIEVIVEPSASDWFKDPPPRISSPEPCTASP
jgi:copper(I)-binding protein